MKTPKEILESFYLKGKITKEHAKEIEAHVGLEMEVLLIEILAKMEGLNTAQECRRLIKEYFLNLK